MKLAIVEDEKIYVDKLRRYLEKYQKESGFEIQSVWFSDGSEIAEDYAGDCDIILMDIQMKFMDGISAARKIREMDQEVIIMFITNMTQYAICGYEVEALDYMVKPVEYFSFSQKLGRAIERLKKRERNFISIPIETGMKKLDIAEIYYVESCGHNLIYYTQNGNFVSRGTVKDLEEIILPYGFFRSNKGFLVNMRHVEGIQDGFCSIHGEQVPVSRAKRKAFMNALTDYVSEVMK
ncbi:MAG: LytTR family DNA-binding domain-containing protein [Eubacteriales bacterium]|nr:LytTR family DNA-binding domain-containing protein [Eubacteriales bacterium]